MISQFQIEFSDQTR